MVGKPYWSIRSWCRVEMSWPSSRASSGAKIATSTKNRKMPAQAMATLSWRSRAKAIAVGDLPRVLILFGGRRAPLGQVEFPVPWRLPHRVNGYHVVMSRSVGAAAHVIIYIAQSSSAA